VADTVDPSHVDDTSLNTHADHTAVKILFAEAGAWRDADPDPQTRGELARLLARAVSGDGPALTDLADRFAGTLQFGTAGLRGALGAGPNRMNRVVVIRAAAGLAGFLLERVTGTPRVVVGFDARHNSDVFAHDTCAVLAGAGCEAMVLPRPLPTPVLAFAVRHLGTDAGVMVTASHNPPQDNGYKVYLGGRVSPDPGRGVLIVPPADAAIAAAIAAAGPLTEGPLAEDGWHTLDDGILNDYLAAAARTVADTGPRDLNLVSTPLHGVGGETLRKALQLSGFQAPYVVPEQAAPDPDFPTVAFPNPEEPGAIVLALDAAAARGADLVIANDPDADRCAVALPDPALPPGPDGRPPWRRLRGDELGALLGEHVLARRTRENAVPVTPDGVPPAVACSIVSSQLLGRIAAAHGCRHVETLPGLKWIARVEGLVFGYEEALGYCVAPQLVRDKDGITAALLAAELAAELRAAGRTLLDALDDLARAHGVYLTDQLSIRVEDLRLIDEAMRRLRSAPPAGLGGGQVVSCDDLSTGGGGLPPIDGVRFRTDHGVRVVVRPSGTEPKLKCYLEAVLPPGGDLVADRARVTATLRAARTDLAAALGV
jgi:phosphomannomutase